MHRASKSQRSVDELAVAVVRIVALAIVAIFSRGALHAQQQSEKSWVGKLVLPRSPEFELDSDGKHVRFGRRPVFYRVVEAKGSSLLLKGGVISGWAPEKSVVPLEKAAGFFTDYIRNNPRDVYGYAMRALVGATGGDQLNRALSDYNQAIQLEPTDEACELTAWKQPNYIDTLAAAQAEVGDFDAAVKSQLQAMAPLTDEASKQDYRGRLILYEQHKPYRLPSH